MLGEGFAGAVDRREAAGEADDEVADVGDGSATAEAGRVNREMDRFSGDGFASAGAAEIGEVEDLFDDGFVGGEGDIRDLFEMAGVDGDAFGEVEEMGELSSEGFQLHVDGGGKLAVSAGFFIFGD